MITLYINPDCPFCRKTVEVANELGAPLTLKSIHDEGVSDELVQLGGKRQMPYMVDDETGISMYESEDIQAYLHKKYDQER